MTRQHERIFQVVSIGAITPKDVITWLVTQPNANGTLYLENVARGYMSALRSAPPKLEFIPPDNNLDVFACRTVDELDVLWAKFKSAPNYIEVNRKPYHGAFSAGLAVFRRYLDYLAHNESATNENEIKKSRQAKSQDRLTDIIDFEDGKDGLRAILNTHFQMLHGYSNIYILWDAAKNRLSMFLNDNAINTDADLWRFVCNVFDREYVLSHPHIWQTNPTCPLNVRGIIINLARQCGGIVTREHIDEYFSRIKICSPINAVVISQDDLLFYNKGMFIPTDNLNLNGEWREAIAKSLSCLFTCEDMPYIILRDIKDEWFSQLPEVANGTGWTPLLLQEALRICPDIGYRVIAPNLKGQSYDTLGAAIVADNTDITTFADVVHRHCYERYKLPHTLTAEGLRLDLRNAGMIEGNELIYNMDKVLKDHRFAFDNEKNNVKVLER